MMVLTYKFRVKNHEGTLNRMASAVNFVWNYCNETGYEYIKKHNRWINAYTMHHFTKGCSKELGIRSSTIQEIAEEHAQKRRQFRKVKLAWRSAKKSLGWIPFKGRVGRNINVKEDVVIYNGHHIKFWKSREIPRKILCGSFNQDARRRWYVNFTCEVSANDKKPTGRTVGIDLGLKTLATLSDGKKIDSGRHYRAFEEKLIKAQKANKTQRIKAIHKKIENRRKDEIHKITTALVYHYDTIFVGDVDSLRLLKTNLSKSVHDSGWGFFRYSLGYKAIRLGVNVTHVKEIFSTVTCSTCNSRTGPSGLSGLEVRNWQCPSCGAIHDRDVNAAKNILNFGLGHQPPKGALIEGNVNRRGMGKITEIS